MRGPEGVDVEESADLVRTALFQPVAGPPFSDHVVPGDKVVIAQAGNLPGGQLLSDAIYLARLPRRGSSNAKHPARLPRNLNCKR